METIHEQIAREKETSKFVCFVCLYFAFCVWRGRSDLFPAMNSHIQITNEMKYLKDRDEK